jgi:microsomal dipeptidase-like Zn-dependent dipeptidase
MDRREICTPTAAIHHPGRMETIAVGLWKRGYTADAVDKILGRNFYRLLNHTIG